MINSVKPRSSRRRMEGVIATGAGLVLAGCVGAAGLTQPDLHAEMTDSDVSMTVATLQSTLEASAPGQSASWSNPDTGMSGTITAGRAQVTSEGFVCRRFTEQLDHEGRTALLEGRACRDDDGVWRLAPDAV